MKNEKRKEIYPREFKLKFLGYGDWLDEPDEIQFEYKDIKCLIVRILKREPYAKEEVYFGGHLCGYISLPEGHPLYGKKIDEIDLHCYRGITYAENTDEGFTIGFDCGHIGDLIPSMAQMRKVYPDPFPIPEEFMKYSIFNPIYRNMDFCIKECKSMARQAAKMNNNIKLGSINES